MEIRRISLKHLESGSFTEGCNLFTRPEWIQAQGDEGVCFGVYKGSELKALFSLYHYKKLGRNFFIDPIFAPHCGLHIFHQGGNAYTTQSDHKRILRAVSDYFKDEFRGGYIIFSLPEYIRDIQPFLNKNWQVTLKYTYILNTEADTSDLLKEMSPERRKNIRQAEQLGYEVVWNSDPDGALRMISDTLQKGGAEWNKDILRSLVFNKNPQFSHVHLLLNGASVATVLVGFDHTSAYYLGGGQAADSGATAAGTFAIWQAILETRRRNLSVFNFLGSSIPSIEKYFRGFGANLTPYYTVISAPAWLQKVRNLKKRMD